MFWLTRDGLDWQNKTECTDEALCAVRDYLYAEAIRENHNVHGYEWTRKDGKVVELIIKIREPGPPEGE